MESNPPVPSSPQRFIRPAGRDRTFSPAAEVGRESWLFDFKPIRTLRSLESWHRESGLNLENTPISPWLLRELEQWRAHAANLSAAAAIASSVPWHLPGGVAREIE